MAKYQILLTNDDGIRSPGLWAAAEALSNLGFVTVAAPRDQSSGMGRSLPGTSEGTIQTETVRVNEKDWTVYSVSGSPAQAVLHGMLEIMPKPPDLVVSGINYGENVGTGVTISGTVGAALEAASHGIRALAMSLETELAYQLSHSREIDFSAAAYFTAHFAQRLLEGNFPQDMDVLKVDVPCDATSKTDWQVTRVSRQRYYEPVAPVRKSWQERGYMDYRHTGEFSHDREDSDVYVLRVKRMVSVTPLSLDLTSRVEFEDLNRILRGSVNK